MIKEEEFGITIRIVEVSNGWIIQKYESRGYEFHTTAIAPTDNDLVEALKALIKVQREIKL